VYTIFYPYYIYPTFLIYKLIIMRPFFPRQPHTIFFYSSISESSLNKYSLFHGQKVRQIFDFLPRAFHVCIYIIPFDTQAHTQPHIMCNFF